MQLFVNSVFKKLPWSKIFQGQRWMTLSHFSLFKYRTFSFICPMYIDCGIPYSLVPFFYFFLFFASLYLLMLTWNLLTTLSLLQTIQNKSKADIGGLLLLLVTCLKGELCNLWKSLTIFDLVLKPNSSGCTILYQIQIPKVWLDVKQGL